MVLIGIAGKKGSGKDSLASYLGSKYGFVNIPFAKELKSAVRRDFGFSLDHTDGMLKESKTQYVSNVVHAVNGMVIRTEHWTPRDIMIAYGQFFRQFDKDYWVKKTFDKIQEIRMFHNYGSDSRVTISDVRFKNEADYIRSQGGILVRLERKPELNVYKDVSNDISETDLDDYKNFDLTLPEESNINPEDLSKFADGIMRHIEVKK